MGNFYTRVICNSPHFHSTRRISDPMLLEPITRGKVQAIVKDAAAHSVHLAIYETYRSQARQEQLFEDGATRLRKVGVHHYGLACDIVFMRGGEPSWKGNFAHWLGHLARGHGLIWGGDWGHPSRPTTFPDGDHVQRVTIADQARLFRGEWYPGSLYVPAQERR